MGRPHLNELARRQQRLLIRSAELRVALAHEARALQAPLALGDQLRAGTQWLRQHPLFPVLAVALLALKRPRVIMRWGSRLLWGWGLFQQVRDWLGSVAKKQA